jgi:hypothetical protein
MIQIEFQTKYYIIPAFKLNDCHVDFFLTVWQIALVGEVQKAEVCGTMIFVSIWNIFCQEIASFQ